MKHRISILILAFIGITFFSFVEIREIDSPGTITFIGNAGGDNLFTVNDWKFTMLHYDPNDFTSLRASIEMNVASITCEWKELETSIVNKKDYFHVKKYPICTLDVNEIIDLGDGNFQAQATLGLRNKKKDVKIDFTRADDNPNRLLGGTTLIRQDFGFKGKGPKNEVPVSFDILLVKE